MTHKRDRHAAIRGLVAGQAIGSQGDLVAELAALGYDSAMLLFDAMMLDGPMKDPTAGAA